MLRRFEAICVKSAFEVKVSNIFHCTVFTYLHDKTWYRRVLCHRMIVYFVTIESELAWSWPGSVETCKFLYFNKNIVLSNETLFTFLCILVTEALRKYVAVFALAHRSYSSAGHSSLSAVCTVQAYRSCLLLPLSRLQVHGFNPTDTFICLDISEIGFDHIQGS